MATKLISLTAILLFAATLAEAAPPRTTRRSTTQRPTTKTAPKTTTGKPATKPAVTPTKPRTAPFDPPPIPPAPKREEDTTPAVEPKAAIPNPTVSSEVKAKTPVAGAPGSSQTVAPDANGKYRLRYHFS